MENTKTVFCPDLANVQDSVFAPLDHPEGCKKVIMRVHNHPHKRKQPHNHKRAPVTRVVAQTWTFDADHYKHARQIELVQQLWDARHATSDALTPVAKIALQQIHRKLYGYAQQDHAKGTYCADQFLTLAGVLRAMLDCELLCHYCSVPMSVLYDLSREGTQWTVDRINNQQGHNADNFHLACLDCNLKRRCRNDQKFLSYKQLVLVKEVDLVDPDASKGTI